MFEAWKLAKKESPCRLGAWTTDGKVFEIVPRGKVRRILSDDELDVVQTVTAEEKDQGNTAT